MSVGFSRGHDAVFMNEIARMGNDVGNFIFIDSYEQNWRDQMNQSLMDSLAIALESSGKLKFQITNAHQDYDSQAPVEANFIMRETRQQTEITTQPQQQTEEEEKKEARPAMIDTGDAAMQDDGEEDIFDMQLAHQEVLRQELLTQHLVLKLIVNGVEYDLTVDYETVQEPNADILLQAKLQFSKKRMFDFIQELQKKDKNARKGIYEQIKQIDQEMD